MKNTEEKLITCARGRAGVVGARKEGSLAREWLRSGTGNGRRKGAGCLKTCYFYCGFLLLSTPTSSSLSFEYS